MPTIDLPDELYERLSAIAIERIAVPTIAQLIEEAIDRMMGPAAQADRPPDGYALHNEGADVRWYVADDALPSEMPNEIIIVRAGEDDLVVALHEGSGPWRSFQQESFDGGMNPIWADPLIAERALELYREHRGAAFDVSTVAPLDPWDDEQVDLAEREAIEREPMSVWTRLRHPAV